MTNVKIPWLLTKVSLWRRRAYGTIRLSRCAAGKNRLINSKSVSPYVKMWGFLQWLFFFVYDSCHDAKLDWLPKKTDLSRFQPKKCFLSVAFFGAFLFTFNFSVWISWRVFCYSMHAPSPYHHDRLGYFWFPGTHLVFHPS